MEKRAVLFGGMGFPATELPIGMPTFKVELEKLGWTVLLVNWSYRQEAANFMRGFSGPRIALGDSLGGGSSGQYPGDWSGKTDFAGAFQPSDYDARSNADHIQIIAPNIARAVCIYDPWWIDTGGLGHSHWRVAPMSETKLMTVEHRGAHPDDWSWSQAVMLSQIRLIGTEK